jgi:hypothetical protein
MWRETVAVGTENTQVLYPVIIVVTVNVVKLKGKEPICSFLSPSALFTVLRFKSHFEESPF